jgi:DNA-binding PadR family transcriptional regulator
VRARTIRAAAGRPFRKPAAFHILLALADGDNYGYGVIQAIRDGSGGRVPLSTGSFYRHLSKLMDDGLVTESTVHRVGDDPRRGAYYRLTALGQRVLKDERQALLSLVAPIDELTPVRQKRHA